MAARKRRVKAQPEPAEVEGIKLSEVNDQILERYYEQAREAGAEVGGGQVDLEDPAKLTRAERVRALVNWYRVTTPKHELGECNACGGDSDLRLPECPFCGEGGILEPQPGGGPPKPDPVPPPAEPETIDAQGEEVEPEPPEPEPEPAPAPAAEPPKAGPKRKIKSKGAKPKAAAKPAAAAKQAPAKAEPAEPEAAGLVKVKGKGKGKLSIADLDRNVAEVQRLKVSTARDLWALGQAIKGCFDQSLWKLRRNQAGVAMFQTFKQFCPAEYGLSYMHAHRLMQVAAAFTREEMDAIGVSKCHLMLSVPPDRRKALLEAAKGGASRAQLSEAADDLKDGEKPKRPRGALTVAMAPGRVEIPLQARIKGKSGAKSKPRAAKQLTDDPWARELLANDVAIFYAVVRDTSGDLVLVIERSRATEDEQFPEE